MLAGIEKALRARKDGRAYKMTAIEALLDGLIDYAGLYPPSGLDLPVASQNYENYSRSKHKYALGRFIIDAKRIDELRRLAGDGFRKIPLSAIAAANTDWDSLLRLIDAGARIETIEAKPEDPSQVECIVRRLPTSVTTYFEVPSNCQSPAMIDAICASGARAKLRMGGVIETAFPSSESTVKMIQSFAERHLMFKATGGLHHPLRSRHPLTYSSDAPVATMHGFVNLFCAAALIHSGGDEEDARSILNETNRDAWRISAEAITWRSLHWSAEQIHEVRQEFFVSFGSCSFTEPIEDLEALAWL
jgi:hypothetical protein